jgi:hypothetical protein
MTQRQLLILRQALHLAYSHPWDLPWLETFGPFPTEGELAELIDETELLWVGKEEGVKA